MGEMVNGEGQLNALVAERRLFGSSPLQSSIENECIDRVPLESQVWQPCSTLLIRGQPGDQVVRDLLRTTNFPRVCSQRFFDRHGSRPMAPRRERCSCDQSELPVISRWDGSRRSSKQRMVQLFGSVLRSASAWGAVLFGAASAIDGIETDQGFDDSQLVQHGIEIVVECPRLD